MACHLSHLSTVLVAMLLAAVTTADSLAAAAGKADAARTAQVAVAGSAADPSSQSGSDDGRSRTVDLGVQPVLLLDRTLKPVTVIEPLLATGLAQACLVEADCFPSKPDGEALCLMAETTRQPQRHHGIALLPHGPPADAR